MQRWAVIVPVIVIAAMAVNVSTHGLGEATGTASYALMLGCLAWLNYLAWRWLRDRRGR